MPSRSLAVALSLIGACLSVRAAETVRVDSRDGAPCLTIDGKPVRARCFWGAPGTQPLPLTKAGQGIEFEFSCRDDEPARSTMHFRFGNAPGDVWLTDIRVRDLDARQDILPTEAFASGMDGFHRCWNIWPPDRRNTVGSVAVAPGNGPAGSATLHVAIRARLTATGPTSISTTRRIFACGRAIATA